MDELREARWSAIRGLDVHLHLPQGRGLPADEFARRHRGLVALLWLSAVALLLYSALEGYALDHAVLHMLPVASFGLLALMPSLSARLRAACCALGLLSAAALLVHTAHGLTETHFAFFVLIVCLTVYEDWLPFLTAVVFVVVHHGVFGMIDPDAVYSGVSLGGSPWKWAAVHALFVAAAGAGAIVVWGANEKLRGEKDLLIERLSALSHEDQLTGLPNRRAWDTRFREEIERARRSGTALSVGMLDLDNLKVVNDELGHEAGDQLLRAATAAWGQELRETDFIARLGGDEFGILLPDCDTALAAVVLQRLVDSMRPEHGVSAGVATWDGQEPVQALVKRADIALYAAKDAGRSCVEAAQTAAVIRLAGTAVAG